MREKKSRYGKTVRDFLKGLWWRGGGSNSRPLHCERSALPAELPPPWNLLDTYASTCDAQALHYAPFPSGLVYREYGTLIFSIGRNGVPLDSRQGPRK